MGIAPNLLKTSDRVRYKAQQFAKGLKTCTKCGEGKTLDKFEKHKATKDGFRYWCRACRREDERIYQKTPKARKAHSIRMAKYNKTDKAKEGRKRRREKKKNA